VLEPVKKFSKTAILTALLIIAASCGTAQSKSSSSRPTQWAVSVEQQQGLGNFYKISDHLYRGKQPTAQGFTRLKSMGVKTVIDLRDDHTDKDLFGKAKFKYERIPMRAKNPQEKDVIQFLKLVTNKENAPIFVHCQRGADRTGFMCASYRIAIEGWSKDDAIKEMTKGGYHFSPLCYNLADFIRGLDFDKIRKEAGIEKFAQLPPK
jgi:protein tyrosine/serine phosphatase